MTAGNLIEPSVSEETKIEEISTSLYERIQKETEKRLMSQLKILGWEFPEGKLGASAYYNFKGAGVKKAIYPDDPLALATYFYNDVPILGVRISDNQMGIEFDVPDLLIKKWKWRLEKATETQTEKEVQDV